MLVQQQKQQKEIFNPNVMTFDEKMKLNEAEEEKKKEQQKREKQSPFNRWTQFNLEHTKKLMWLSLNHPKAHTILYFLVDQMDEYNAVMCSYQVLQEIMNISKDTVRRSIKTLKDNGFIAVMKTGTSNVYAVNDSIYWKSWGNNKKYSKFPANVILGLSEQDKGYQLKFELEVKKHKEVSVSEQQAENVINEADTNENN